MAAACHPLALTAAPSQGLAVPGEPMFPLFRRQEEPTQAPPEALWQITEGVGGRAGDALDFCRVEAIEPGHLLRLRAEMKLPGLD